LLPRIAPQEMLRPSLSSVKKFIQGSDSAAVRDPLAFLGHS
jgi:hypothetical protein